MQIRTVRFYYAACTCTQVELSLVLYKGATAKDVQLSLFQFISA